MQEFVVLKTIVVRRTNFKLQQEQLNIQETPTNITSLHKASSINPLVTDHARSLKKGSTASPGAPATV